MKKLVLVLLGFVLVVGIVYAPVSVSSGGTHSGDKVFVKVAGVVNTLSSITVDNSFF